MFGLMHLLLTIVGVEQGGDARFPTTYASATSGTRSVAKMARGSVHPKGTTLSGPNLRAAWRQVLPAAPANRLLTMGRTRTLILVSRARPATTMCKFKINAGQEIQVKLNDGNEPANLDNVKDALQRPIVCAPLICNKRLSSPIHLPQFPASRSNSGSMSLS